MRAEIFKCDLCRNRAECEILRNAGDDDLATVRDRKQTRDPVDGRPEIISIAFVSCAGVDGGSDA